MLLGRFRKAVCTLNFFPFFFFLLRFVLKSPVVLRITKSRKKCKTGQSWVFVAFIPPVRSVLVSVVFIPQTVFIAQRAGRRYAYVISLV